LTPYQNDRYLTSTNLMYQLLMVIWFILVIRIIKFFYSGYKVRTGTSFGVHFMKVRKSALLLWNWLDKLVNA